MKLYTEEEYAELLDESKTIKYRTSIAQSGKPTELEIGKTLDRPEREGENFYPQIQRARNAETKKSIAGRVTGEEWRDTRENHDIQSINSQLTSHDYELLADHQRKQRELARKAEEDKKKGDEKAVQKDRARYRREEKVSNIVGGVKNAFGKVKGIFSHDSVELVDAAMQMIDEGAIDAAQIILYQMLDEDAMGETWKGSK